MVRRGLPSIVSCVNVEVSVCAASQTGISSRSGGNRILMADSSRKHVGSQSGELLSTSAWIGPDAKDIAVGVFNAHLSRPSEIRRRQNNLHAACEKFSMKRINVFHANPK